MSATEELRSGSGSDEHEGRVVDRLRAIDHLEVFGRDRFICRPEQWVHHSPSDRVQTRQCSRRETMPQSERVKRQKSPSCSTALLKRLHRFNIARKPADLGCIEVFVEEFAEHIQRKQVNVKWILEVSWSVGRQHNKPAAWPQYASDLGDMSLGVSEMLNDVRRTNPVERICSKRELSGISAHHAVDGDLSEAGCSEVIVKADHRSVISGKQLRFGTDAATDIETDTAADAVTDELVSCDVERDQ